MAKNVLIDIIISHTTLGIYIDGKSIVKRKAAFHTYQGAAGSFR